MKKTTSAFAAFLIYSMAFSQSTQKVTLAAGQKILIVTEVSMDANLGMGMDLNSTSTTNNLLTVKNITTANYTISNTLTKVKVNMNMMGQSNNYDSENKESNNEDMAKVFDDKLNKTSDYIIDNNTGKIITENKNGNTTGDSDKVNLTEDMLKVFSDNSDEAIVSGTFEILPASKKIGDSWADTANTKESKTIRTYTLQSITGNEAVIKVDIASTAKNKVDVQEMEMEIATQTKTIGEIVTDITTGVVKKRNTVSDITGSFQLMGQDMPITAKVTTVSTYQ